MGRFSGNKIDSSFEDTGITVTPAAFAPTTGSNGETFLFQAQVGNTDAILIGNSTGQFIRLAAGDVLEIDIDDVTKVWRKAVSGTQAMSVMSKR